MISIIIPIHNQADKLKACLNSILKQTETDWEIILVDDGSTDGLKGKIDFPKDRFYFYSKANEGSSPTRNYGFERSKGEYVIFCDADIIMRPNMLETMKKKLEENPQISFVYGSFKYGAKLFRLFPYDEGRLRQMPFIHTTSLIRRKDFPGFDTTIKRLQDWDLWLTMLEQRKRGIFIDEVLFTTQIGNGHFSNWLPKITYRIFPFLPSVKKYQQAVEIIKKKHKL